MMQFIWVSMVLPAITSFAISYIHYQFRVRQLIVEESPYQVGTEVKTRSGEHQGKPGIIVALLTLETLEGKATQAGIEFECGCMSVGEQLANLEVIGS